MKMNDYILYEAGFLPDRIDKSEVILDNRIGFAYLSNKAAKQFLDDHQESEIIGYTYLKQVDRDKNCLKMMFTPKEEWFDGPYDTGYLKYHQINYKKYLKHKDSYKPFKFWHHVKGYTLLDTGDLMGVVSTPILLILLPLILMFLIFIRLTSVTPQPEVPDFSVEPEHAIEEAPVRKSYTETIDIPGYQKATLTSENKEIQLINPAGNSVFFIYTVLADGEEIYKTDGILPDNSVMADLWSLLDAGDHNVTLSISTFDLEDKEPCNGSSQDIVVTVEK